MSSNDSGVREAALTLHALPAQDREWVMNRLEPRARQRLQPLLDELHALNIPQDRELVAQALAALTTPPTDTRAARRALMEARASDMVALLKSEAPGLIARLLAAHPWPWAEALRQALDGATRQRLAQAARDLPPMAPECRLQDWLVEALASKLQTALGNGAGRAKAEPRSH